MLRRLGVAIAVAAGSLALPVATHAGPADAHPAPAFIAPPSKRVYMVSDSVGLGARTAMPAAFPSDWQVTVDGTPALFVEQLLSQHVQNRAATNPSVFGDFAIVAGGYNYPYWDPARFDRSIDAMVDALLRAGTKQIFWVTLREVKPEYISASGWKGVQPYYWYFPTVNEHLRRALDRHPQLSLIDWASMADQPGLTYDAIHLNTAGARVYSDLAADTVQTAATRRPAGTVSQIAVAGIHGVAADSLAVSANLTVVNPRSAGYLSVYPCGSERPVVSNINVMPAQTLATTVVVPIGADGTVCIYQSIDAHVLFDQTGAFGADSGFVAMTPSRALDTRNTPPSSIGPPIVVDVGSRPGVPPNAAAVVLNLTTIGGPVFGNVTVYTCGTTPPAVPTRSVAPSLTQNLLVVAVPDRQGKVCVQLTQRAEVIVDVFGALTAGSDIHPVPTQRLIDTRGGAPLPAGSTVERHIGGFAGLPPAPQGVIISVGVYGPSQQGYATVYPCALGRPFASMLNTVPNRDQMNGTLVAADANGSTCVFLSFPAHLTVDVSGWIGTAFRSMSPVRLLDTRG